MPHHIAKQDEKLYIYTMGKRLKVTAIFSDDDSANAHMARHKDDAVIAVFGSFVFLANKYDHGERATP